MSNELIQCSNILPARSLIHTDGRDYSCIIIGSIYENPFEFKSTLNSLLSDTDHCLYIDRAEICSFRLYYNLIDNDKVIKRFNSLVETHHISNLVVNYIANKEHESLLIKDLNDEFDIMDTVFIGNKEARLKQYKYVCCYNNENFTEDEFMSMIHNMGFKSVLGSDKYYERWSRYGSTNIPSLINIYFNKKCDVFLLKCKNQYVWIREIYYFPFEGLAPIQYYNYK